MKQKLAIVAAVAALGLAPLAHADAAKDAKVKGMMTEAGCFACHAVDHKLVGPAYEWVAYRYKGDKGAVKKLAEKVLKGGAGNWNAYTGGIPMSPNPSLGMAKAEEMVEWVLEQKPVEPPKP